MKNTLQQQLEVPGFRQWEADCRRDARRIKGEHSGTLLPLFDSIPSTPPPPVMTRKPWFHRVLNLTGETW